MAWSVREVDPSVVAPLAPLAARSKINLKLDQKMTSVWFAAMTPGGAVLGFGAVGAVAPHRWRLRALWVRPDERGQGLSSAINAARLAWIVEHGEPDDVIDGWHNSNLSGDYWSARGLHRTGKRKRGDAGAFYFAGRVRDLIDPD